VSGWRRSPASLLELLERERVTIAAGVPTVWLAVLEELDRAPGARDLTALRSLVIGGAAAPQSLIDAYVAATACRSGTRGA
jgi:fatty-acyl-CoA synthase